jgi:excisionase family DNA binding protein
MKQPTLKPTLRSPNQNIPLSDRPTLSVDEACRLLGIGRSTFYKAVTAGDVKVRKYGKRTLVTQDELKRFVDNMPFRQRAG